MARSKDDIINILVPKAGRDVDEVLEHSRVLMEIIK